MHALFSGRINRGTYLVSMIALCLFAFIPSALAQEGKTNMVLIFPAIVLFIFYILLLFSILTRRFHDLNKSGKWSLLVFIPFLNTFVFVYLLFAAGNIKKNEFGPVPSNLLFSL